jgi:antitoxin HicB
MAEQEKGRIGSSFEDFLVEEGILDACTTAAIKRVLARQVERAMREQNLTKSEMARRMRTSRPALDRHNTSVTLNAMQRAAAVVGRRLRLELV